jgi:putative cell wall-binding protein
VTDDAHSLGISDVAVLLVPVRSLLGGRDTRSSEMEAFSAHQLHSVRPNRRPIRRLPHRVRRGAGALLGLTVALTGVTSTGASAATSLDWKVSAALNGTRDASGRLIISVSAAERGDSTSGQITIGWSGAEFVGSTYGSEAKPCSTGVCTVQGGRGLNGNWEWVGNFALTTPVPNGWGIGNFAFTNPPGVIRLVYSDADASNNAATVSGYRSDPASSFTRIAGADRIDTALAIANDRNPSFPVEHVIIARSDNYPDALAAGPLATGTGGVLLFTPPTQLDPRVEQWITTKMARGGQVTILGGAAAVSPAIESRITSLGYRTRRIAGADRFETAIAIDKAVIDETFGWGPTRTVYLADGRTFADAVCAGAAASAQLGGTGPVFPQGTLLLADGRSLSASTVAWLTSQRPARIVVMGDIDTTGLPGIEVRRILGPDAVSRCASPAFGQYAARQSSDKSDPITGTVGVALVSADSFPDGLAAAAHASSRNLRVVLTPRDSAPASVRDEISRIRPLSTRNGAEPWDNIIYGGPAAISETVLTW